MRVLIKNIVCFVSILFITITFAILLSGVTSCKKSKNKVSSSPEPVAAPVPTVEIPAYMPAYPGSNWVYRINNKGSLSTQTIVTGPEYVLSTVLANIAGQNYPVNISKMVPVYNGTHFWGNGYWYNLHGPSWGAYWASNLNEQAPKGKWWHYDLRYSLDYNRRINFVVDTSIILHGTKYEHVIGVRHYVFIANQVYINADEYYARDIGLLCVYGFPVGPRNIKPDEIMPRDSVNYSMELISYFINK